MKKLSMAILSILFFLPIGTAAFAQEIIGCVHNKKGTLRIVSGPEQCTKFESPISWNRTGPQGEQGPQGEPGPQGPPGATGPEGPPGAVMVIDNNGQELGYLLGHIIQAWDAPPVKSDNVQVFVPSLSATILISKYTGHVVEDEGNESFYYESPNCTGQPFINGTVEHMDVIVQRRSGLTNSGAPTYYMVLVTSPEPFYITSHSWVGGGDTACNSITLNVKVREMLEIPEDQIPFTLPVSLPLHYQAVGQ